MSKAGVGQREMVDLLAQHARTRATGILSATRGKHKRLFCLDRGWLVFARSNVIEEQFAAALSKRQVMPSPAVASATKEATEAKQSLGTYLIEQGYPPAGVLTEIAEELIRTQTLSSLAWTKANFEFEKGRPDLDSEMTVRVSVVPLILDHLTRNPESLDDVRVKIGAPRMLPIVNDSEELIGSSKLSRPAVFLLENCDGTHEIPQLVEMSGLPEKQILRALCGFLMLRILTPADTAGQDISEFAVTREEIVARLERATDGDHYGVLGVVTGSSSHDVREAYYFLARRYHPDRFRSGALQDLLASIEIYFSQVTEAYNTLHDERLRTEYDRRLEAKMTTKETTPEKDKKYLARQNYARARVLIDKKRLADAVQFLENAIQLDDSDANYHLELGRVLSRNPRRRDDAIDHLETCTRLDPTKFDGYFQLGLLLRKAGRDEEAATSFQEVLRWEPTHVLAAAELDEMGLGKRRRKGLF